MQPLDWDIIMRLAVALFLGAVVGIERERHHRGAGLKTHALVSVGAAVFTVVSIHGFAGMGRINDPSRVAAQIVSGIGFLGAGTIMKQGPNIRGLTTAASLWVVAGIGTAVGAGMVQTAVATTVLVVISILIFKATEEAIGSREYTEMEMLLENQPGNIERLQTIFKELRVVMKEMSMDIEGSTMSLRMTVDAPRSLDRASLVRRLHEVGASKVEMS